ncbi:hypothetical protein RM780_22555 [Streptomyces sp. DSM 44917]|uniref:Uncharacterized protein n=1 Tax=Streptomyces boetiae TaxID=3075541 RepID=A0ABU2LEN2_9ACTN|nr:hypothetical protein [Streptomyces sp. DSM 44917]MDT0309718.1 hypothetical protein [Streptomyces sp. DSM 44917]
MTTRLDTVRAYFIERFFEILTTDPDFAEVTEPAELFGPDGRFDVPATPAGFVRIPTDAALRARIEAATDPEQREQLERFRSVLERTLAELFGLLGYDDLGPSFLLAVAARCAPVVRHPDTQTYWPVDIDRYLTYEDGVLRGQLHTPTGVRPLAGAAFGALFDNPEVWQAPAPTDAPEGGRRPFTSTIGVDAGVAPYPASPLTAGHLNLPAGDARLTPGRLPPTLFTEIKSPEAASRLNRHYTATASRGGRFAELRNNRVHTDPIREVAFPRNGGEPLMFVYHAFYPADDGARRLGDGGGSNREFHHLAAGLLMSRFPDGGGNGGGNGGGPAAADGRGPHHPSGPPGRVAQRLSGLLFVSTSPTKAAVIPLDHPSLRFVDEGGEESPDGLHPVLWANNVSVQGLELSQVRIESKTVAEGSEDALDYDPDDWQWWVGYGSAIVVGLAVGAAAGAAAGGVGAVPGALIGLIIALFLFPLAWLLKKLFGGDKDRQEEWTEQEPWPGDTSVTTEYTEPRTQDIGPPGVVSETGGATPGRSYTLRNVPHFPGDNLYGLEFSGGETFRITDDAERQQTLAWRAFTGGVGYQFQRPVPGRSDVSGTSLRDYFELFTATYQELLEARDLVVYFDEPAAG